MNYNLEDMQKEGWEGDRDFLLPQAIQYANEVKLEDTRIIEEWWGKALEINEGWKWQRVAKLNNK